MTKSEMNMVEDVIQRIWDEGYGAGMVGLYKLSRNGARLEDHKMRDKRIKALVEAAGLKVDEK